MLPNDTLVFSFPGREATSSLEGNSERFAITVEVHRGMAIPFLGTGGSLSTCFVSAGTSRRNASVPFADVQVV
jgi:hypothetical protein